MSDKKMNSNELMLCPTRLACYNHYDVYSILTYALQLKGKTFLDILHDNGLTDEEIDFLHKSSMTNKGLLGNLIEEAWFGYPCNGDQRPDLQETGIEIKSTPCEKRGDNIVPGETLSITQIDYTKEQETVFEKSHVYEKIRNLLIIYYLRDKEQARIENTKLRYKIEYVFFLQPLRIEKDRLIIKADFDYINNKIIHGMAASLSRTDGNYLGIAPKSSRSRLVPSFYGGAPALKSCYVLKKPYLSIVIKRVICGCNDDEAGSVITDVSELENRSMAEILEERLKPYIGKTIEEIWEMVRKADDDGTLPSAKNKEAIIACRMLGVKKNRIEEFESAGILPKTIVFNKQKSKNQQFRIEDINFIELNGEDTDIESTDSESESENPDDYEASGWESSTLYSLLADRKYFFIVFWETNSGYVYKGCQLWGMPDRDIEVAHHFWRKVKEILRNGVSLEPIEDANGKWKVKNNLPGITDNGIIHIRPHATRSYHLIKGVEYYNETKDVSCSVPLPNGDRITNQSYWLNRAYIESVLSPNLVMKYD